MPHTPVLKKEVIEYLDPEGDKDFIDCTVGQGGHSLALLERTKGRILGIDWDKESLEVLKKKVGELAISERLVLVSGSFAQLGEIARGNGFLSVSGILFDLGMCSWHLEESGRGFSFQKHEPLDMRYNLENSLTAAEIVNKYSEKEISDILKEYGQERFHKRIAKEIVTARQRKPIEMTSDLVDVIKKSVPSSYWHQRIHFATRTFQALRIAVNKELENLRQGLFQSLDLLEPGARLLVISFHSLEDRIVKHFFREKAKEGILRIITKKPIGATKEEIKINPRSRSAKVRAAEKA